MPKNVPKMVSNCPADGGAKLAGRLNQRRIGAAAGVVSSAQRRADRLHASWACSSAGVSLLITPASISSRRSAASQTTVVVVAMSASRLGCGAGRARWPAQSRTRCRSCSNSARCGALHQDNFYLRAERGRAWPLGWSLTQPVQVVPISHRWHFLCASETDAMVSTRTGDVCHERAERTTVRNTIGAEIAKVATKRRLPNAKNAG